MKVLISLLAVAALFLLAWAGSGVPALRVLLGVVVPYAALVLFLWGFTAKILGWARIPVPFRIPTTCGQQRSLPWIASSPLENPSTKLGVAGRMALEVLCFRSLMRNTNTEVRSDGTVVHSSTKWLWVASLAFHWCFLVVLLRHTRFFFEPGIPGIGSLAALDALFEIGAPALYLSGAILLVSALYLFLRRIAIPMLRYTSLPADYFPLFLIIGIAGTGIFMRHFARTDVTAVKEHMMSLVSFGMAPAAGVHWLFYAHLLLVCTLLAYFPFSKLMHLGGVFFSPTRNLANNNRAIRHVNPWDAPVKTHPYPEYEDEFRDKMKGAGIPVDKE